jgi:hypothetical protein
MNEPLSDFISGDSRSGGLARVSPALSKTGSEAAWQSRSHGKTIGANLNLDQLNVLSLPCAILGETAKPYNPHSWSCTAAPRFSPTSFYPLAVTSPPPSNLIATNL